MCIKNYYTELNLVEKHIINETIELKDLSFKCKNLYNKVLYIIRQDFINNGIKPNKYNLFVSCKDLPEYKELNARVARGVIRTLVANWDAYFVALNSWFRQPNKFNGKPKLPKYLPKDGRFMSIFPVGTFSLKSLKNGFITLSTLKELKIPYQHKNNDIIEIQVIPIKNIKYKINIVYYYNKPNIKPNNNKYASIDLGLNNLMTITSNTGLNPIIVNGRSLKNLNQYFNKKNSFLKSELKLKQDRFSSKNLDKLSFKRENKINDYLHKSSKFLIQYCIDNQINTIIIGYNKSWKQGIKLGKKNNQNFVSIPFYKLVEMIKYKAEMVGLNVTLNEESYTSVCSFLDLETINKHDVYLGERLKRGLFRSSKGILINADVNGSYNIMRKVVPNVFTDGIEGVSVHPIKINF
ncbi:transposase [bacterium]|jgi:putative transposase|nr:transposase [bacterium]